MHKYTISTIQMYIFFTIYLIQLVLEYVLLYRLLKCADSYGYTYMLVMLRLNSIHCTSSICIIIYKNYTKLHSFCMQMSKRELIAKLCITILACLSFVYVSAREARKTRNKIAIISRKRQ